MNKLWAPWRMDYIRTPKQDGCVFCVKHKSNKDKNFFRTKAFDIGLCTSWQRIIPKDVLSCFRFGVFGWHGSGFEFPNGRGRSPINWSIRLGLNSIFHNCFAIFELEV